MSVPRTRLSAVLVALAALVAPLFMTSGAEAAPNTAQSMRFKNVATGQCLDSNSQGHVYVLACNSGANQVWIGFIDSNRRFGWRNAATGRCLDDSSYGLRTYGCNSGIWQAWDGDRVFHNRGTNNCIDHSWAYGLRMLGCNGGTWQQWVLP